MADKVPDIVRDAVYLIWESIVTDHENITKLGERNLVVQVYQTHELMGGDGSYQVVVYCNKCCLIWKYKTKEVLHNGSHWFQGELENLMYADHMHNGSKVKSAGKQ